MTRPRRMTKGSNTNLGPPPDRSPSPPRSSSSSSAGASQRHTLSQKKKQKQRETAEMILSTPAYRGSALSMSDMGHPPPSRLSGQQDEFDSL